jgi:ATP-dependent DNA helicase DinG
MDTVQFEKYFPHEKIRESQETAISFAIEAFLSGKKYVILEAGTGVGKSAIGIAIARYLANQVTVEDSYKCGGLFLTTQKILQDQYIKDYSSAKGLMETIKSSANYSCRYLRGSTCAEGLRALKTADKKSQFFKTCAFRCTYKKAKEKFVGSSYGITNFSYFLAETQYVGKIKPHQLLVVDEAHNSELELSKFIEIGISKRFCTKVLKIPMPDFSSQRQAINWVEQVYEPRLSNHLKHVENMLEKYVGLKEKIKEFANIANKFEMLDKHACKLRRFLSHYSEENWVFNYEKEGDYARLEFKPVDISKFAKEYLFKYGKQVLMMSATILNKDAFCELLGIEKEEAEFISIASPFPKDNRPIIVSPIGKMSASTIDQTLPKLVLAIEEIIENHDSEKGIIHCHSYKIANYLKRNIKSKRFLIHDSSNRDMILEKHMKSKKPTILLSPSMTEGIDLKGEMSRFQIICKVPYPYLGDKLVKKKMNKWRWWYPMQTAKTIVQSVGRSVRNKEDFAVTYILDSDWNNFYRRNSSYLPPDFSSCILK